MDQSLDLNFEYIAAHISDYIQNENFFDTFDISDIKTIMKYSCFTFDEYITLLKQSSPTLTAKELYISTRKASVTIQNFEEVISILKSIKKYMKFNTFDGIIDFINENQKHLLDSTEETKKPQTETQTLQNQIQNSANETTATRTNESRNYPKEFLNKISSLKKSDDFDKVYKFFEDLSSKNSGEMTSKACEEGLWLKNSSGYEKNVLHIASENGNLNLVKLLIKGGCDKESKSKFGETPLIWASANGHLEIVKYLISVGADIDAKTRYGWTPLIHASYNECLEVVKYLISAGADKDAKTKYGTTALSFSKNKVRDFLISIGAK
ncbi:ankyrin repeat protein, putative [Trichomonas vaginalis G3]|uniref:Ankyrin repeat protein, putative n=1 Tax=Trichomonas vaginalis (strain ATCC PRA-98 / G3) TaxID=412133 RepID=A2DUY5_TRIV3|nr:spectrin binding [Trichomonas vaginalis G3]EAY15712.1 ankyrin repeat protein, putative [Trichomonas vaginalis G3]KAI5486459.1 spectrin binding [Trichomonas vaginalis G3]|eukprot:XP_001327935.1 ankyrin repeat protein [Trichomonas vaginalis G3]